MHKELRKCGNDLFRWACNHTTIPALVLHHSDVLIYFLLKPATRSPVPPYSQLKHSGETWSCHHQVSPHSVFSPISIVASATVEANAKLDQGFGNYKACHLHATCKPAAAASTLFQRANWVLVYKDYMALYLHCFPPSSLKHTGCVTWEVPCIRNEDSKTHKIPRLHQTSWWQGKKSQGHVTCIKEENSERHRPFNSCAWRQETIQQGLLSHSGPFYCKKKLSSSFRT